MVLGDVRQFFSKICCSIRQRVVLTHFREQFRNFSEFLYLLYSWIRLGRCPAQRFLDFLEFICHGLEGVFPLRVKLRESCTRNWTELADLLAKEDDIHKDLKLLVSRGLEVVLFHVLHPDEVSLPFEGDIVFESLEDDPNIGLDPQDVREEYQKAIQSQIEAYRSLCLGLRVDYVFLETTTPLEQALSYYLLKRQSLSRV